METLAIHPSGNAFVMGGRLRGGDWNVAAFDMDSGHRIASLKLGFRTTQALFSTDGERLIVVGSQGQPKKQGNGQFPDFGRVEIFKVQLDA